MVRIVFSASWNIIADFFLILKSIFFIIYRLVHLCLYCEYVSLNEDGFKYLPPNTVNYFLTDENKKIKYYIFTKNYILK